MSKPHTNYDAWVSFIQGVLLIALIGAMAIYSQKEAQKKGIAPRQSSIWSNLSK